MIGLTSELYQLRGRWAVRSAGVRLPAAPPNSAFGSASDSAMKEFSDSAGFRIAALDLELRGAGNIRVSQLRPHRSRFDIYTQMLGAPSRLKGEAAAPELRTT
jgi:transcription-repair coupling factor (superfamily II helicase)